MLPHTSIDPGCVKGTNCNCLNMQCMHDSIFFKKEQKQDILNFFSNENNGVQHGSTLVRDHWKTVTLKSKYIFELFIMLHSLAKPASMHLNSFAVADFNVTQACCCN